MSVESFSSTLARRGLALSRGETNTLQINIGFLCNQLCRHCHLEAGPDRFEMMTPETMEEVLAYARRGAFRVVDITGGAPELHPGLGGLIAGAAAIAETVMLRSNLTVISAPENEGLLSLCQEHRVVIVASLPASNLSQTEAMRGKGVWGKSMAALEKLNAFGFGVPATGLELHLVSNPTGAFLPASQSGLEGKFRQDLERKRGITFNNFFTFANVPLGRFRRWLVDSGNLDSYMERLASSFNPCTIEGLMCRSLASVSWDGCLYDCDFNLAQGIPLGGRRIHVSEMEGPPAPKTPIAVSDHCYACTAGSGFT